MKLKETKKIILITGTEDTRRTLHKQIHSLIYPLGIVDSFASDEGLPSFVTGDLIVLSTGLLMDTVINVLDPDTPLVIARRMIDYDYIDQILVLPMGKKVLLVNDVQETTYETIDYLKRLGIDHLNYKPYYPGGEIDLQCTIAITPGERHLVPNHIKEVIDIGPRLIDMTSIMEIFRKLNIIDARADVLSEKYIKKIIQMTKKIAQFSSEKSALNQQLMTVINNINDAIVVTDEKGNIHLMNDNMENLLKVSKKRALHQNIRFYLQDKCLLHFIFEEVTEKSKILNYKQQDFVVERFWFEETNLIVITFKNPHETLEIERKLKRELINKGYVAKYHFPNIIGESRLIKEAKEIANKLARVDYTILIEGESGTGKELFASAIHNASARREGPFLGVNFSALSEELVESELFGYEEGAFTGAKKGGKIGLFEQANGGTIFLDEIGDISHKIQTRLLRVLQEKEIMRVGGSRIIPIDVRIIAATNKNLLEMIEIEKFRDDLYHRLKTLYLHLPPLRMRKEDLELLIQFFLKQEGRAGLVVTDEVIHQLKEYNWYGNVRELKNIINYMVAVSSGNTIQLKDLPNKNFFQRDKQKHKLYEVDDEINKLESYGDLKEFSYILAMIEEVNTRGENIGRGKLIVELKKVNVILSEQKIRYRLDILEQQGYITKGKGRSGSKITIKGRNLLTKLKGL